MSIPAVQDDDEHPIPSAWRGVITQIVDAFVESDYGLAAGVLGVAPVPEDTAEHLREYIEDYGDTLVALPPETWDTSVCSWTGSHWDAFVDLWTDQGCSDMVLKLMVAPHGDAFVFTIRLVYVP